MERVDDAFPAGVRWSIPFDTTDFVRVAIKEVFWTLGEAIILVFLVVFLFLQNWRTTLIPCLAVPVSLTGALAGMRSEEHTSELQSLMRISYAVFCLKTKRIQLNANHINPHYN